MKCLQTCDLSRGEINLIAHLQKSKLKTPRNSSKPELLIANNQVYSLIFAASKK